MNDTRPTEPGLAQALEKIFFFRAFVRNLFLMEVYLRKLGV